MERAGLVVRLAHGFYVAVPDDQIGTGWEPSLESAGVAIATAMQGERVPVLMGLGAARFHQAIPRAIAVTTVAVPAKRNPIDLTSGGKVLFVTRDVAHLDARLERLDLGRALVTSIEQTAFDLMMRPDLGGLSAEAVHAMTNLAPRVDVDRFTALAQRQTRVNSTVRNFIANRLDRTNAS